MAKKEETHYTCVAEFTEGCGQRLTDALVAVYYNRLKGIGKEKETETEDQTKTVQKVL